MEYPELNPNENAYPNEQGAFGLTKRELFAAMAMQANRSRASIYKTWKDLAEDAVEIADALIEELNK